MQHAHAVDKAPVRSPLLCIALLWWVVAPDTLTSARGLMIRALGTVMLLVAFTICKGLGAAKLVPRSLKQRNEGGFAVLGCRLLFWYPLFHGVIAVCVADHSVRAS